MSVRRVTLAQATALVAGAMVLSRFLGFFRNSIVAFLFGQGGVVDAYNVSYIIPDTLYLILIGGGVSSAFIPVLSRYLHEGREDEVWRVVSIAFTAVLIGISLVVVLGVLLAPYYMHLMVLGWFSGDKDRYFPLLVALTQITIITILFHSLNGVLIGTEYTYSSFVGTSIGPLVYNTTIIVAGYALAHRLGIMAFAWATLAGAFFNFLVQIWGVHGLKPRFHFSLNLRHPGVLRVGRLMLPIMIGLSIAQINLLINQSFLASLLPLGSINALTLSSRIMLMPVFFATSVGITLLPNLTRLASTGDMEGYRKSFGTSLRAVLFVSIPASLGLIALSYPIIHILFQHGKFNSHNTFVTSQALIFYALGIAAYGAYEVLSRAFYALEDTMTPLKTGLATLAVGVLLNFGLIHILSYRGLALAYSITGFVNMVLLLVLLQKRVGTLHLGSVFSSAGRTVIAATAMAAVLVLWQKQVHLHISGPHLLSETVTLLVPIAVGTLMFALFAWLLRVSELRTVLELIRRRVGRRKPVPQA